jgi:uncharacterized protein
MSSVDIVKIPKLGVGVGYRPAFHDAFLGEDSASPEVSWVEVITENFLPENGRDTFYTQILRRLRERIPVALHGVSLSLGSTDPLHAGYLDRLAWLEREIEPWLVSDHLCWTGAGGENLFDLLPLPASKEALDIVAANVQRVQDKLRRPLAVENITYYSRPAGSEMGEEQFLNELARRTGCKFLLDLNNIHVNSVNHGLEPRDYLRRLDLRHVAQVHLAGHAKTATGLLLDTHGAPVSEEVWSLYEWFQVRAGALPTMIERDENIPDWEELVPELRRLASIQRKGAQRETPRVAARNP